MPDRLIGKVVRVGKSASTSAGRPEKHFYIISSRTNKSSVEFLAFWSNVTPDRIGRRHLPVGTLVSFLVKERDSDAPKSNHTRPEALDVRSIDLSLDEIDPARWREIGIVKNVDARLGVITRANRIDLIDFRPAFLGPDLRRTVKSGDRLEFSVVRKELVTDTGDTNIQIYTTNLCLAPSNEARKLFYAAGSIEEYFLKSLELPLEK
jgi:hypothetical protein